MNLWMDVWKVLAGVALFLLGMNMLEEALRRLAGRSFKLFLKRQTSHKFKGIVGGMVVTGILQSSSVVNLMVLAFTGAGIIAMQNALALVLGANIGSTINSWIVATIGFQFNIESFALPFIGLGGIGFLISGKEKNFHYWCRFLLGFGLLFIGLSFIKSGVEVLVKSVDLSAFHQYSTIIYVLIGFIVTAIVQSSSATMAITLSALDVHAITLYEATALVLGSEAGTSIKMILASIGGNASKKRVSAGNVFFNIVTTIISFIFLKPLNQFITQFLTVNNPLIALVSFQTLINAGGVILFYPFLNILSKRLEKMFLKSGDESRYITSVKPSDANGALIALEKESRSFVFHVVQFGFTCFEKNKNEKTFTETGHSFISKQPDEQYDYIKHLYGEVHAYYLRTQKHLQNDSESEKIQQIITSVRNCMYAAKSMHDAWRDIQQLKNSGNDIKYNFYVSTKEKAIEFFEQILFLLQSDVSENYFEHLSSVYNSVTKNYTTTLQDLYKENMTYQLSEPEISTLINFNRELVTSFKALVFGVKDLLLDAKQSQYFDDLPGFIR